MIDAPLPREAVSPLHGSVIACLASILEIETTSVPVPPEGHPEPWTIWRNWLAQQGLGLVPVLDPQTFRFPGPWLALLGADSGADQVAAVAFGVPPGLAWKPLGGNEHFDAVEAGYVIAPLDVALWPPRAAVPTGPAGTVEALVIASVAEGPVSLVDHARAVARRGLEGDRHFDGRGTFSNANGRGHDLTLIEGESIDRIAATVGDFGPGAARRNVVTRGIELNALVGKRFTIGEVLCEGQRLCEPCAHLERLTEPGVLRGLVRTGGLRADILSDGIVRVGDAIRVV